MRLILSRKLFLAGLLALPLMMSFSQMAAIAAVGSWSALSSFSTSAAVLAIASPAPGSTLSVAVTSDSFYRSADKGKTWQKATAPLGLSQDKADIEYSPGFAADKKILISTNESVFLSTNAGVGFTKTATDPVSGANVIQQVAFSPTYGSDQTIFAGTSDGLYVSTNSGAAWAKIGPTMDVAAISFSTNYSTDKLIYLGGADGLYRLNSQTLAATRLFYNEIYKEAEDQIQEVNFISKAYVLAGIQHIVIVADDTLMLLRFPNTAGVSNSLTQYVKYLSYGPSGIITDPERPTYGLKYFGLDVYPLSLSSLTVSVLTDAGFYRLTGVGYSRAGTPARLGGLPHAESNSLTSAPLGEDGYVFDSGTGAGIRRYTMDLTPPTTSFVSIPQLSTDKSTNLSFPVSWKGSDTVSSVATYIVGYRYAGSSTWSQWISTGAKSATFKKAGQGKTVYFRIRAKDAAGNWSGYTVAEKPAVVPVDDKAAGMIASGSWSQKTGLSGRFLGTGKRTKSKGASVSYSFTGKRVWILAAMGRGSGKVRINIDDGAVVRTKDTYANSLKTRQKIFVYSWPTRARHTVKITNLATAGRAQFELDGVAYSRD